MEEQSFGAINIFVCRIVFELRWTRKKEERRKKKEERRRKKMNKIEIFKFGFFDFVRG